MYFWVSYKYECTYKHCYRYQTTRWKEPPKWCTCQVMEQKTRHQNNDGRRKYPMEKLIPWTMLQNILPRFASHRLCFALLNSMFGHIFFLHNKHIFYSHECRLWTYGFWRSHFLSSTKYLKTPGHLFPAVFLLFWHIIIVSHLIDF